MVFLMAKTPKDQWEGDPWMSCWKLGSMVNGSVGYNPKEYPIYKEVITHLLTIDPNFLEHPSGP